MKNIRAAGILSLMIAAAASAQSPDRDPFRELNRQIDALPEAARGLAFVAAVMKTADHCEPGGQTSKAVRLSFARLAQYASQAIPRDDLARALGLGTQVSITLRSLPGFQCSTSGLAMRAGQVPGLVAAEMKRAPDPRRFESDRITVIAR